MIVNETTAAKLKKSVDAGNELKISAVLNTVDSTLTVTADDIIQNTFSIDRYVQTGNTLEVGSVCSSELKFTINNRSGKFNNVTFEGAEIVVSGTIPDVDSDSDKITVKLGTFTIDEKPRSQSLIQIVALDDMVKLDKVSSLAGTTFTGTCLSIVNQIVNDCFVSYDIGSFGDYFSSYNVTFTAEIPADTTSRQLLSWVCQLGLCNAYITVDGKLAFKYFKNPTNTIGDYAKITENDRYSHTIEEKVIGTKEIVYKSGEGEDVIGINGTTSEVDWCISLNYKDNPLFENFYGVIFNDVTFLKRWWTGEYDKTSSSAAGGIYGLRYIPFSANIRNFFWLEPMDKVRFYIGNTSNYYDTWIMHTTFSPGKAMKIEAKGEGKTKSGYASLNPLTAQEQKILNDLRKIVTAESEKVTDREYQLIEFNKAINNGMAMYQTTVDGVEYYHDSEDIALSTYIMVQNSEGIAWTDSGWNDGSPVWKYGISSNGEAILNSVDAYKIRADLITVTDLKAFNATIGGWNIGENKIYAFTKAGTYKTDIDIYTDYGLHNISNNSFFPQSTNDFYTKSTRVISCKAGEKFRCKGYGVYPFPCVIFFDYMGCVVDYDIKNNGIEEKEITVPSRVTSVVFQSYSTEDDVVLEVEKIFTLTRPLYTFFETVSDPEKPVWASGAEGLSSYDKAGFLLYSDGRVKMGGNTDNGYVFVSQNEFQLYSGESNDEAKKCFIVGVEAENEMYFTALNPDSNFSFYNLGKKFVEVSLSGGIIKTNYSGNGYIASTDVFAGLQHYRTTNSFTAHADFGVGDENGEPTIAFEVYDSIQDGGSIEFYKTARFDVYKNNSGNGKINLRLADGSSAFQPLRFDVNKLYYSGKIYVNEIQADGVDLKAGLDEAKNTINSHATKIDALEETVIKIEKYLANLG